jgi:hypothetical protein
MKDIASWFYRFLVPTTKKYYLFPKAMKEKNHLSWDFCDNVSHINNKINITLILSPS